MKNILLLPIFLLIFFQSSFSQNGSDEQKDLVQLACEGFLNGIVNDKPATSYEYLAEKVQGRESIEDFSSKLKKYQEIYGELKALDDESKQRISVSKYGSMGFYSLKFEHISLRIFIRLEEVENSYKVTSYMLSIDSVFNKNKLNELASFHLGLLTKKKFEELHGSIKSKYPEYDEFLDNISVLSKGGTIIHELSRYEIEVNKGVTKIEVSYDINKEGDIIFIYKEENGILVLQNIRFYLSKQIAKKEDIEFKAYLVKNLSQEKIDSLSRRDSSKMRLEFIKLKSTLRRERLKKDLERIEGTDNPKISFREGYVISALNQFKTQKDNKQLGIDLLSYNYSNELRKAKPMISQSELQGITWQHFIQDNKKEGSFRIFLSNDALLIKTELIAFFEKSIEAHIAEHVTHNKTLKKAVKQGELNIGFIEDNDIDAFWNNTSSTFKLSVTKDVLSKSFVELQNSMNSDDTRILMSRQYHDTIDGSEGTGFYIINFSYKERPNRIEQIIFQKEGRKLKIIGFQIHGE